MVGVILPTTKLVGLILPMLWGVLSFQPCTNNALRAITLGALPVLLVLDCGICPERVMRAKKENMAPYT